MDGGCIEDPRAPTKMGGVEDPGVWLGVKKQRTKNEKWGSGVYVIRGRKRKGGRSVDAKLREHARGLIDRLDRVRDRVVLLMLMLAGDVTQVEALSAVSERPSLTTGVFETVAAAWLVPTLEGRLVVREARRVRHG